MKKKLLSVILSLSIVATMSANFAVSASSIDEFGTNEEVMVIDDVDNAIELLDRYVTVEETEEGINVFKLDAPDSVISRINPDILSALNLNINMVNENAIEENVIITDNGTVYTDEDIYILQSGTVNKAETYWWGYKLWADPATAKKLQRGYRDYATGLGVASLTGVIPGIGTGLLVGFLYEAGYYTLLANKIGDNLEDHPNNGVIITVVGSVYFNVEQQ